MCSLCVLCLAACFLGVCANRVHFASSRTSDIVGGPVSYKNLASAKASSIKKSIDVVVSFGTPTQTATLTRGTGVNKDAFKNLLWQEPDSLGLTTTDRYYIDKYTGRFDYSRNVGVVLRGIVPFTTSEDSANKYEEQNDHAKLTLEVLKWAVGFGTAINKLPVPQTMRPLWRGAWESKNQIQAYMGLLQAGGQSSVPWFQPLSSDQSYAPTFLQEKYAPPDCKDTGCIKTDHSFPVLYEFHTAVAKDLTEWNPKESEFMLLPNTAFKVRSVEKIINDKLLEMDNRALVAWLERGDHRHLDPKDDRIFGPWPLLAKKVKEKNWSGAQFIKEYDSGHFTINGPYDYHWKYLANLNINEDDFPYDLQSQLTLALRNRYKLPPVKPEKYASVAANTVPFYYKIIQEDGRF